MKRLATALTLLAASVALHAEPTTTASHTEAVAQVQQVVETFRKAIIQHDGSTLASLFLPEHSHWLSIQADPQWREVKAKHPEANPIISATYQQFTDFVATSKKPIEEQFSNIHIDTDGNIAAVYFDFLFLEDGAVENRGSETWQLLKTDRGWKIGSMLYSSAGNS